MNIALAKNQTLKNYINCNNIRYNGRKIPCEKEF